MGVAEARFGTPTFAEDIRLIIWDLDETFWEGTLTEGGIRYRKDHHRLIVELARRGIMSAICSKNDAPTIKELLTKQGIWDYFIFPSIDWTPKGPRIAAMLDQIGLRAPSALFIDDNPMNLAQAAHANPGLNVGLPSMIKSLRDAPQLRGKDDPELTRLEQYKVAERKADAAKVAGGDTLNFLRQSNVRVFIDYDVDSHLDRAIELINRTNQLNFTKLRLPEDRAEARRKLSALLALNTTDSALIRVQDDYGDYGYVGFYLTERLHNNRRLTHFCFSCRTLNMYVEHWVYRHLGRPPMQMVGPVLSNVQDDPVEVDWIRASHKPDAMARQPEQTVHYDTIIARGGCDLASLMHYFALHTDNLIEEFNHPHNGQMFRRDHSEFLMPALGAPLARDALTSLGYEPDDFRSALGSPPTGRTLFFLSFWADADIPLYRHRATGQLLPYWLVGAQNHDLIANDDLRMAIAETDIQRDRLKALCRDYDHVGLLDDEAMLLRYRKILDHLPADCQVVLVLAPERGPLHFRDPARPPHPHHQRLNRALRLAAEGRPNVILLDPADFITGEEDMIDLNHFRRPVYHRMYLGALAKLHERQEHGHV